MPGGVIEAYIAVVYDDEASEAVCLQGQDGIAIFVGGVFVGKELSVFIGHDGAEDGGEPQGAVLGKTHGGNVLGIRQNYLLCIFCLAAYVLAGAKPKLALP